MSKLNVYRFALAISWLLLLLNLNKQVVLAEPEIKVIYASPEGAEIPFEMELKPFKEGWTHPVSITEELALRYVGEVTLAAPDCPMWDSMIRDQWSPYALYMYCHGTGDVYYINEGFGGKVSITSNFRR